MVVEGERAAEMAVNNMLFLTSLVLALLTARLAGLSGWASLPLAAAYYVALRLALYRALPMFAGASQAGQGTTPRRVGPEPRRHMDKALWALFFRDTMGAAMEYMDSGVKAVAIVAVAEDENGVSVRGEVLGGHPALLLGAELLAKNLEKGGKGFYKKFGHGEDA